MVAHIFRPPYWGSHRDGNRILARRVSKALRWAGDGFRVSRPEVMKIHPCGWGGMAQILMICRWQFWVIWCLKFRVHCWCCDISFMTPENPAGYEIETMKEFSLQKARMKGSLFIMGRDSEIPDRISQVSVFFACRNTYIMYIGVYNIYVSHHLPKAIFVLVRVGEDRVI